MRDLTSHISAAVMVAAATYSATPTAIAVDLQGFDSAVLHLALGVGGITFTSTNKIDFVLTHSDDGTTYTAVTADDLIGNDAPTSVTDGIVKSLTAAHASAEVLEIGYIGGKRYLELVPTFSGTHATGTPLACNLVKGTPWLAPAA